MQDQPVSQFYMQLQEAISGWLASGNKSGTFEIKELSAFLGSIPKAEFENQDRVACLRATFSDSRKPSILALILCDGMGGMVNGGECANLTVSSFVTSLVHNSSIDLADKILAAVQEANNSVYKVFQGRGGSTLSVIACDENANWTAVNIGDSRMYVVLKDHSLRQITIDDTLENHIPNNRNFSALPSEFRGLLQHIGMGEGLEPNLIEFQNSKDLKWILMTSDGIHGIPASIFKSIVKNSDKPKRTIFRLTELSKWLGRRDDSTAIIFDLWKDTFPKDNHSKSSGSLELWSVFGKSEFFNISSLETGTIDASLQNVKNNEKSVKSPRHKSSATTAHSNTSLDRQYSYEKKTKESADVKIDFSDSSIDLDDLQSNVVENNTKKDIDSQDSASNSNVKVRADKNNSD